MTTPISSQSVRPRNILIIDDDYDLAEMVSMRLNSMGFIVSVANDGPTGIATARKQPFDLVVLDVMMPGMDGFEVCAAMKQQFGKACPKIVLFSAVTAGMSSDSKAILQQTGADGFLAKPYSAPVLLAKINELLQLSAPASVPASVAK